MKEHDGWNISATPKYGKYGWLITKVCPGIKALIHSASDNFATPEAAIEAAISYIKLGKYEISKHDTER